jgi:hypothetical protein
LYQVDRTPTKSTGKSNVPVEGDFTQTSLPFKDTEKEEEVLVKPVTPPEDNPSDEIPQLNQNDLSAEPKQFTPRVNKALEILQSPKRANPILTSPVKSVPHGTPSPSKVMRQHPQIPKGSFFIYVTMPISRKLNGTTCFAFSVSNLQLPCVNALVTY